MDLQKLSVMKVSEIEAKLPSSFLQLHKVVTKILIDNQILPDEEESKVD